jgi:hypothetical protein
LQWKDFLFQVAKWWAIIAFSALLFYLVYPKYDMNTIRGFGIVRLNKITGKMERLKKSMCVNVEHSKSMNIKQTRVPVDLLDDSNITDGRN